MVFADGTWLVVQKSAEEKERPQGWKNIGRKERFCVVLNNTHGHGLEKVNYVNYLWADFLCEGSVFRTAKHYFVRCVIGELLKLHLIYAMIRKLQ